jgi:hypothetical protein
MLRMPIYLLITSGGWFPELIARLRNHNMALIPTMTLLRWKRAETKRVPTILRKP